MRITDRQFDEAVEKEIISAEQAAALAALWQQRPQNEPRFSLTHVLFYFGGLVAIGPMTIFMGLGLQSFGGAGIVAIAALYALVGLILTHRLARQNLAIPAGICAAFVMCIVPVAGYGVLLWSGIWPDNGVSPEFDFRGREIWSWVVVQVATLVVGIALLRRYKFPFLLMPIAVTLWWLGTNIAQIGPLGDTSWRQQSLASLWVGLILLGVALVVDVKSRDNADYAFWLYIIGAIAFWTGLTFHFPGNELTWLIYFCMNLLMVGVGVMLVRRVFVVLGALGSFGYLVYLSASVFEDSWLFPVALTLIGFGIIYLGILWQRHESTITAKARRMLPRALRELLDART